MPHSGQLAADEAAHAAAIQNEIAHVTMRTQPVAVAKLPAATTCAGARACVTDATLTFAAANFGATAVGGGTHFVPVISDGTNWIIS